MHTNLIGCDYHEAQTRPFHWVSTLQTPGPSIEEFVWWSTLKRPISTQTSRPGILH